MPSALIIDDVAESLLELSEIVQECGFRVDTARDTEAARAALARDLPDAAILNLHIGPSDDQDQAFHLLHRSDLPDAIEVYLLTDDPDFESARRGMRAGASDVLRIPDDLDRLRSHLERLAGEVRADIEGRAVHRSGRGLLQGESPAMSRVYRMIRKVAPTRATVFLAGESGAGKELIARTIHELSDRGEAPFIAMNCGAMPKELIESELFGHRKGAFTGAHSSHKGFFERATGGTLLLDEVTEMSAELQVKLLRVLETGRIRPVGGEKEIGIDVRIIAATNRDPEEAVDDGALRQDLYYRLAEFPLRVPPLRERGEDVVLLAEVFLQECNEREDSNIRFSQDALDVMRLHDWPGNVRELKNAVSRGHILATDQIRPEDLPANIPSGGAISGDYLRFPVGYNLKELERRMLLATLEHFENDKRRTAEALGISLKTLYNRLKAYSGNR
jgi:DNA-binding NtrC family response regulator